MLRPEEAPVLTSHRGLKAGFSLIEIVLAIGIVSFAIMGIIGLFPVALRSAQESQRQTRAALIAQQIYSDLTSVAGTNRVVLLGTNAFTQVNLAVSNTFSFSYDQDCTLLGVGSNSSATYQADVSVTPDIPIAGLSRVQTTVFSPASAPASSIGRSSYVFVTSMSRN